MFLQPKFDMKTLKIVGSEALVRWIHPTRGFIPPCDFIPLFDKYRKRIIEGLYLGTSLFYN